MNRIGAKYRPEEGCLFTVWAPEKKSMMLHIVHPHNEEFSMEKDNSGYFSIRLNHVHPGYRYFYKPDGLQDYPDPASSFQPTGVHGPSEVYNQDGYKWHDHEWHGFPGNELILYEVHVGTFTPEGIFSAIIPHLDDLKETGINALELMPVSQFPGERNWGYDGVYPYAVQNSYGGPDELKRLVDECHARGIMVFLDAVYNHLGPEGNYLSQFGPYFTARYQIPWGNAINFDGDWSDGVREYFAGNVLYWFEDFHIDGLRLDAIHTIFDSGAVHFWEFLQQKIQHLRQKLGRYMYLIAESDLNSPRVIKPVESGGFGFNAQWLDDFHHALYVILDPEGKERYEDFGRMDQLSKAYTDGFVHSGEYVFFRKRKHGASSAGISGEKFIVFNQNHDQIGNRVKGDRLSALIDFARLKLAAAAILLSPYIPMLFMGEEYSEEAPFYYFVSHSDKNLIKAVREGRKREFENYKWKVEPPDPQSELTFLKCKIDLNKRNQGRHQVLLKWNKELISMRRNLPALRNFNKNDVRVNCQNEKGLLLFRKSGDEQQNMICVFNFSDEDMAFTLPSGSSLWKKIIDSKDSQWLIPEEERPGKLLHAEVSGGHTLSISKSRVVVFVNKGIA